MNEYKRVSRNALYILISNLLKATLGPILVIFIARVLGSEQFGVYAFAISFAGVFIIIAEFGIPKLISRDVAMQKESANKYLGELLLLKPLFSFSVFLVYTGIVFILNKPLDAKIAIIILGFGIIVIGTFDQLFCSLFQAFEQMKYITLTTIINTITTTTFSIIALTLTRNLIVLSIVISASYILSYFIEYLFIRKNIAMPILKFDLGFWKQIMTRSFPFAVSGFFIVIFSYADTIMISFIKGDYAVGIYSAAYKIIWALMMFPTAIMGSVYPYLSTKIGDPTFRKESIVERIIFYLLVLVLPIIILIFIYANQIMKILFGEGFSESSTVLRILIFIPLFSFCYIPLYDFLNVNFKQKTNAINISICATLNVILNSIFIVLWGVNGASLATLISECLLFFLCLYFAKRNSSIRFDVSRIIRVFASASIMLCLLLFTRNMWYISIPSSIFIYLSLILLMKAIRIKEIRSFVSLFGRG